MKGNKFIRLLTSHAILIIMGVIIIYPLLWTVGASFNPGNSLVSNSIIPKNPTLDHYKELFAGNESLQYVNWYLNSLKISVFTMIGSVITVSFTAYAFSRFRFKGRKNALTMFLLLQMIPQFSALIALFVLAQLLGMMNSH
ncbi:MAG: sugar ABC transporter permease, partial [Bacillus sp. (in: firmicutes)]